MPRGQKSGYEWKGTPKAQVSPTVADLHWAAGFIEGEGCFSLITVMGPVRQDGTRNGPYFSQRVRASQVETECLERLQGMFGGIIREKPHRKDGREWSVSDWDVSGSRARGVMMTIFALMSSKRQTQIRYALGVNQCQR